MPPGKLTDSAQCGYGKLAPTFGFGQGAIRHAGEHTQADDGNKPLPDKKYFNGGGYPHQDSYGAQPANGGKYTVDGVVQHLTLQANDRTTVYTFNKTQGCDGAHNGKCLRDCGSRQLFGTQPIAGQPTRDRPNSQPRQRGNGQRNDLHASQQITNGGGAVGSAGKACHLTVECWGHTHVE